MHTLKTYHTNHFIFLFMLFNDLEYLQLCSIQCMYIHTKKPKKPGDPQALTVA